MIILRQYEAKDTEEIIKLVLHCQNDGTRPMVSVADQPELLHITEKYFSSGGCFWVAEENNKVAGSIGLMNCGNGIGVLKKFFVYEQYRGAPCHLGQKLYEKLYSFAQKHDFKKLILDTPMNTHRAHSFYEKAGFCKISRDELPIHFDHPYADCDFFILTLT